MAIKKSELYGSLWAGCDELQGGMDASQYKDYVLILLFVKYVSDKYAGQPDALIEVPKGGSFADMVALKGNTEIGDKMNKIIGRLAEANELKGVIDVADFNDPGKLGSGKEMVHTLSNLVAIFENPDLDFSKNRAEGDDILGDAYEYLMRHFATESGKSKGQFYTPAEVSLIIAKVIGIGEAKRSDQSLYDPTGGSGSLLIKAADEAQVKITIYGQEKDVATTALAKMNMILHDNPTAEIAPAGSSTLSNPFFKDDKTGGLKTFDFVVMNPPFSYKSWKSGFDPEHDLYGRFDGFGIPPTKNGDFAFLLHVLKSMKSTGKGAVILPHGVLFRGGAEAAIFGHPEFAAFNQAVTKLFDKWKKANTPRLKAIAQRDKPKALVEMLGEKLLGAFSNGSYRSGRSVGLLNPYDIYQHLMDYWAETMQDDVYMIVDGGWKAMQDGEPNTGLIPEALIVNRYFAAAVQGELDRVSQALTGRIRQLAERYAAPLPDLTDEVKVLSAKVDKHLKKMGFA
jgi:type I restriction-modification system DNA methylase subunit